MQDLYGICDECKEPLEAIKFEEDEYNKYGSKTGRARIAVSHLTCSSCLRNYCVDDSFDSSWYRKGM